MNRSRAARRRSGPCIHTMRMCPGSRASPRAGESCTIITNRQGRPPACPPVPRPGQPRPEGIRPPRPPPPGNRAGRRKQRGHSGAAAASRRGPAGPRPGGNIRPAAAFPGTGRGTTAPAAGRAPCASAGRAALARSAGTGGGAEAAPGCVRPERGQAPPTPRKQRFARPGPHAGRAAAGEKRKGPEKAEEKASAPPPHTGRSAPPPRPARHSGGRADRRAAGGRVPDLGGRAV